MPDAGNGIEMRAVYEKLEESDDAPTLPPPVSTGTESRLSKPTFLFIIINCVATIAVVFLNKM